MDAQKMKKKAEDEAKKAEEDRKRSTWPPWTSIWRRARRAAASLPRRRCLSP